MKGFFFLTGSMPKRFGHFFFFPAFLFFFAGRKQVWKVRNAPHGVFKIKPRVSRLDPGERPRPALIGCSQSGQLPGVIMPSGLNVKVIAGMGPEWL